MRGNAVKAVCRAIAILSIALPAARGAGPQSPAIRIDGYFDDWTGIQPVYVDPEGDGGGSGIDFGRVWFCDDARALYVRFETGAEISLQSGNGIVAYFDLDGSADTGFAVGGIGAELSWRFAERRGSLHGDGSSVPFGPYEIGLVTGPTVDSAQFEIKFPKNADVRGIAPFSAAEAVRWVLRDEKGAVGDVAPNAGVASSYAFREGRALPPEIGTMGKRGPGDVRVVSWNVYEDNLFNRQEEFRRVLKALNADVLCLQEIRRHNAAQVREIVTRMTGVAWNIAGGSDCFTLSRSPIARTHPLSCGVGTLIDLPGARYASDLFIINAHLGGGAKDERRQREADEIACLLRNLRTRVSDDAVPEGTPILLLGDLNLVTRAQHLRTLVDGDIVNEDEFGDDFRPDWDGTPLADLCPSHIAAREAYTWASYRRQGFGPGRMDFILYTDSAVRASNSYVMSTGTMPDEALAASGLQRDDTAIASDHLPLVADFAVRPAPPPPAEN